jgi:hypothetical protein
MGSGFFLCIIKNARRPPPSVLVRGRVGAECKEDCRASLGTVHFGRRDSSEARGLTATLAV